MTDFTQDQSELIPTVQERSVPELESTQDLTTITECSIDPEIEFEQPTPAPAPPKLTPEEIKQAKLCHICKVKDWRYTCPRCLVHSCCMTCVKQHKLNTECSGIRDKTSYVPLREYNESNMMSDYTYLEDMSRQSDNLTRSRLNTAKDIQGRAAENRTKMFVKGANQLGIHFSSLPAGMSRHKLNQSNYSKNLKQIFWTIEVNFCRFGKKERYLEHSFPSGKPFHAFFENLLFSETPVGKGSYGIIRHQVKDFVEAGIDQFNVALKKEKAPRGHFVNVTSVLDSTFKQVLKGENIIEYPIFYIWLKSDDTPKEITVLEDKKMLIAEIKSEDTILDTSAEQDTAVEDTVVEETVVEETVVEETVVEETVEETVEEAVEEEKSASVDDVVEQIEELQESAINDVEELEEASAIDDE